MSTAHSALVTTNLHVPGYQTGSDPGAVGVGKYWIDTTGGTGAWALKVRNAADSGWETIASGSGAASSLSSTFALTGDISPAQITSNQNNYNPTGLSTASTLRLDSDASRDITGLQGGADGRLLLIHNVGAQNIVLKDESGSSTAGNRFALNADLTLGGDQSCILQYDSTSSRWRLAGASTGSSSLADHNHTAAGGDGGDLDGAIVGDFVEFAEASAPGTPASGFVRLYAKSDGSFYQKDDAGTETGLAGGGSSSRTLIERRTLVSTSATETFSSLGSYQNLILKVVGRNDASAASIELLLRVNADTGANYTYHVISSASTTASGSDSISGTALRLAHLTAATGPANTPGFCVVEIQNYRSSTWFKGMNSLLGLQNANSANNVFIQHVVGWWLSTSAITSLTVLTASGNMVAGTIIELWGES